MRLFNHPVLCNYYLTYRCNAKCSFCDIWERPSPYVTMEAVERNLRDLKRLKVKVIDFTGGEPLLHRQLPEFLQLAKQLGFITTVTSNGLLYPKYADKLRGLIDMLHFSLDYADADRHNASRGVPCYDHLIRSLDICTANGERPDVLFTVTNDSFEDIERVYEEITKPRGLMLILNPIFDYNNVGGDLNHERHAAMRKWGWKKNVYINEGFLKLRENGGNNTADPVCVAASSTVVITPEDQLALPCYHLTDKELPIAGELYDLWHRAETQTLIKQEGRLKGCEGCTVNCYMQPSFAYQLNSYFFRALPSTLKYTFEKWVYAA